MKLQHIKPKYFWNMLGSNDTFAEVEAVQLQE